ncbi:LysE family translocator [Psychromonas sp. SP041]|uniref:LysE family translocator n=1 Tax=Psychromonas sp. SP041 TaxID=1365007 RepID=UPI00047190BF|nr:LysE family translocator [Psychromonas sp. SP041]
MDNYLLYIAVAALTIAIPGPGIILTINNAIQRESSKTFSGILGVATGMLAVSILSASGVGIILATSSIAFTIVKLIGAVYLIYLGIKMWRAKTSLDSDIMLQDKSNKKCYLEGLSLTISNPKPILFFMSLFPQFISFQGSYINQFILLSLTFCGLVIIIHSGYAFLSSFAKSKLLEPTGRKVLNKVSGGLFMCFGIGLAASNK